MYNMLLFTWVSRIVLVDLSIIYIYCNYAAIIHMHSFLVYLAEKHICKTCISQHTIDH